MSDLKVNRGRDGASGGWKREPGENAGKESGV